MREMEHELSSITTVTVCLYGDSSSHIKVQVSVRHDNSVTVDSVFTRVCKTIGLQEVSWPWFTLVEGSSVPVRRLRRTDVLPLPCPELCLRKWIFDVGQERTLHVDLVAMELLCKHAHHDITNGHLRPDRDIHDKLEGCLEPGFNAETQYVALCHKVSDYTAIYCQGCVLQQASSIMELAAESVITLTISTRGLHCQAAKREQAEVIPWTAIKCWSHSLEHMTLTFDLVLLGSSSTLAVQSKQTRFMLSVILEIVKLLQRKNGRSDVTYFASDIHRHGNQMTWDNLLYDPGTENPVFEPCSPIGHKDFLS